MDKKRFSHNVTKDFEYCDTPFEKQSKIVDIKGGYCHFVVSSRGTVLRSDTEFIFLGEVIEGFTKKNMIPGIVNSYILKREEGNNRKWNEICCGPWNYLVYYKEENDTKGLINFLQNLKNSSCNFEKNLTHDIEIAW